MTPNEIIPHREAFDAACQRLGWTRHQVEEHHERDSRCSWTEEVWCNAAGERLFAESDLTEAMVQEIVRLGAVRAAAERAFAVFDGIHTRPDLPVWYAEECKKAVEQLRGIF